MQHFYIVYSLVRLYSNTDIDRYRYFYSQIYVWVVSMETKCNKIAEKYKVF